MAYPKFTGSTTSVLTQIDEIVQLKNNTGGPKEARVYIAGAGSDVSLGNVNLTGTDSVYSNTSGDFSVTTNASAKTITVTGLPYSITDAQLQNSSLIIDGQTVSLVGASASSNVITVALNYNFTGSEEVTLELSGPNKGYDLTTGAYLVLIQNPEWAHYTSVEQIVTSTDATVDQHYSTEISMAGYKNLAIQLTGSSGGSGVTFKVYATLNTSAATPADGDATPSANWVDVSTDVLGGASVVLDTGASGLYYVDTNRMVYKYIIQYEPDHATNSTGVFIRRY